MLWYHIVVLALIQGLTEFLPISSSAHLILPAQLAHWPDQGLAFDVAVHVGTLIAVVTYFRHEIIRLTAAWFVHVGQRQASPDSSLAWWIIVATLPACLAGAILNDFIEANLRSIDVIAYTTIGFGILLWAADRFAPALKNEYQLRLPAVVYIGLAQAIALIPGTSRSGITMTAARSLGFTREASARFSFLLSIPLILAAGGFKLVELVMSHTTVDWNAMVWGVVLSALSAYICIYLFLKWLNTIGFAPFLIYRLVLGGFLLAVSYW